MVMLRSPYDEPRDVPWLNRTGERAVEPDELVDVPDELAENFLEAGWIDPAAESAQPKKARGKQKQADQNGGEQQDTQDGEQKSAGGEQGEG